MAASLLIDLDQLSKSKVIYDHAYIYQRLPHRRHFEVLDGICYYDAQAQLAVAYHECRLDEWWVDGHVPGRPIYPGVIQLEAAAQLTVFTARYAKGSEEFFAYGGVDDCRFREAVVPPADYYLIAKIIEDRTRRVTSLVQGVVNGRLVFEATVIGLRYAN